nr:MAG TPA: hypothetical protein [Caudoviricetes sp.]
MEDYPPPFIFTYQIISGENINGNTGRRWITLLIAIGLAN